MAASITEDRGPQIAAVTYVMLVLATVAVALRFWARYIAHKSGFWFDDWALLAALVRSALLRRCQSLFSLLTRSLLCGQAVHYLSTGCQSAWENTSVKSLSPVHN